MGVYREIVLSLWTRTHPSSCIAYRMMRGGDKFQTDPLPNPEALWIHLCLSQVGLRSVFWTVKTVSAAVRVGGAAEQKTGLMMASRLSYAATSESRYMVAA